MSNHFLFSEGEWTGKGKIFFSLTPDEVPFQIHWDVVPIDLERFRAVQRVEMVDQETMINVFTITRQPSGEFQLFLENEVLGVFSGDGVSDERKLAWEFAHYGILEGVEVYEKKDDQQYNFHAEYLGNDGLATTVEGTISSAS